MLGLMVTLRPFLSIQAQDFIEETIDNGGILRCGHS